MHMEAVVRAVHKLGGARVDQLGGGVAAEVEVVRVHVESDLVIKDRYIDAAKWSPLIYNFRHYYRLADTELGVSGGGLTGGEKAKNARANEPRIGRCAASYGGAG